ncbi:MAG: hypothetical protein GX434_02980 [Peptococcaceae bacterium]|nr:hypothetical protein [Peptococcaceae bacterium]
MSQEGLKNIKVKLQELTALIKEQTADEANELKKGLLENVDEMKTIMEESFEEAEEIFTDNMKNIIGELENKALKVQSSIQEKLSEGIAQKDEVVVKTADSLIEAINKMKTVLQSKKD